MELNEQDVEDVAVGAAILGSGGGGDPYLGKLMCLQALRRGKRIRLVDLEEVPEDAFIVPTAGMGTPIVLVEKLPNGSEPLNALRILEAYVGKKAYATIPIEAGGVNSTIPLAVGALADIPIIDGDGMGRAFPELQMTTFFTHGVAVSPMSMADEKGNSLLISALDGYWAEKIARVVTIKFGGIAWVAIYTMTGRQAREAVIPRTVSLALKLGRAVREAREMGRSPLDHLLHVSGGFELFTGKIVDVARRIAGGFTRGEAKIEGLDSYRNETLTIQFQNENLVAVKDGEIVASVPDLIIVLDVETAQPITTERLRYGQRVAVIGMPCHEKWRTPEGLKVVGPRYFGYDVEYVPIERRVKGGGLK